MRRFTRFLLAAVLLVAAFFAAWEIARLKIQEGLTRFLGVPVHVQRVTFSLHRLTLHGVSFYLPARAPLRVERMQLEGSLFSKSFPDLRSATLTGLTLSVAGVPMHAEGRVFLRGEPGTYAQADGLLRVEHPMLRGEMEVTGPLLQPVVFGWLEAAPVGRRHFLGKLNISREEIGLEQMEIQGDWRAAGRLVLQPAWRGELSADGPDIGFRFRIEPGEGSFTRATLWLHPLEQAPKRLTAQWALRNGRLEFEGAMLDGQLLFTGKTELRFPYRTGLVLGVNSLDLSEIKEWIPGQSESGLAGTVQGRLELSGILGRVGSTGELVASRGRFGRLDFDEIAIRFRGRGPELQLRDSYLARRGSRMKMDGQLDVRKIGQQDFFRLVKLTPVEGSQEPLSLRGFEIAPSITPGQNVKFKLEGEEQVIAVEHRKKF